MALGLYNETRDLDLARVAALLPQSVYPEAFRDVNQACNGGEFYGHASLDRLGALDYIAYGGSQNIDAQNSSIAQISNDTGFSTLTAIENKYTIGASVFWSTPLRGLRVGGSYSFAEHMIHGVTTAIPPFVPSVAFASRVELPIYVASLEYTYEDLTIASEFERLDGDVTPSIASAPRVRLDNGGAYLSAEYRLMKHVQVGGYASDYHVHLPDHSNRDPSTYQRDYALTCRFDITDNWLFKLEGHWIRGYAQLLKQDNFAPGGTPFGHKQAETDWLLFVAKTSVNF
jgi:hypothetical protein